MLRFEKKRVRRFTLVELLVAMAVFVVLLGLLLQFFSGAQRMWINMEQRNNMYADARTVMDILSTMTQNAFYAEKVGVPFIIEKTQPNKRENEGYDKNQYKMYFATLSRQNLPGGKLKYVTFQCGDGNDSGSGNLDELKLGVFCDKERDFEEYLPPYDLNASITKDTVGDRVRTRLDGLLKNTTENPNMDEPYGTILARRVTSFTVTPYMWDGDGTGITPEISDKGEYETISGGYRFSQIPYMIEFKLSLLSPRDFIVWEQMKYSTLEEKEKKYDFRKEHEYTISRSVFLGDQSRRSLDD